MQFIQIFIALHERLDRAKGVPKEVKLAGLGLDNQEISLILVGVVIVAWRHDDDPPGILIDLDGVLLIVIVEEVAEFPPLEGQIPIDLQMDEHCVCDGRRHARIQHQLYFLDFGEPLHEILDLIDGEEGLVEVPQPQNPPAGLDHDIVGFLDGQGQVARRVPVRILHQKLIDLQRDDYLLTIDVA